jgi:hypothetical protein
MSIKSSGSSKGGGGIGFADSMMAFNSFEIGSASSSSIWALLYGFFPLPRRGESVSIDYDWFVGSVFYLSSSFASPLLANSLTLSRKIL